MHTSAKVRLTSVAIRIRVRIPIRYPDRRHLFIDPLPTFPENFMQIRSEVFVLTDRQTDRQTTTIILVGGHNQSDDRDMRAVGTRAACNHK